MKVSRTITILGSLIIGAAACPGPLEILPDGSAAVVTPPPPLNYDSGLNPPAADLGFISDSAPTPRPDATLADAKITSPSDTTKSPLTGGGKCPCKNGLLCIKNACRSTCSATGACKATSQCGAAEACIPITSGGSGGVCMPAAGAGKPCDQNTYCPNNFICGSYNKGPYVCLPICSAGGAKCGSGGVCAHGGGGCMFCSKS